MADLDEYSAFAQLTEGLSKAAEGAKRLYSVRPDQPWNHVAKSLEVCREIAFRCAGEGIVGGKQ